jgi:RimJ/RimL family protein N-acetyltransferase
MTFDPQPVLKGNLVELSPLRSADFEELFAVGSDPLIWEQHPQRDRYRRDVFEKFFHECLESGGGLVVRDAKTQRIVGSTRFKYDAEKHEVEIGWTFLARAFWGGHYNGEMKRLMLQHALRSVPSVVFLIWTENQRSRQAAEKIGAKLSGEGHWNDGKPYVLYRLNADEMSTTQNERRQR